MTGKFVAILMLLCVSQLALGADDLAQEKKAAIAKIKVLTKSMEEAYKKVCDVFHKRPVYLDSIKKTHMDLGHSLLELSLYEVKKNAEGARQKAKLLSNSPKMIECIEARREKASTKVQRAYDAFAKAVQNLFDKAWEKRRSDQDGWAGRHGASGGLAINLADTIEDEIGVTNNRAYLADVMANLEKTIAEANRETLSLEEVYKKVEVIFDRTLQNGPVKVFRSLTRRIVDEYIELLNNCTVA